MRKVEQHSHEPKSDEGATTRQHARAFANRNKPLRVVKQKKLGWSNNGAGARASSPASFSSRAVRISALDAGGPPALRRHRFRTAPSNSPTEQI
jgi:hypothetical protein